MWRARNASRIVLALTIILFFARLGERSLWSMEVRWGEIPREMRERGNWLTPTINGHLYYDKPLLSYWLVLSASALTGEVNEFAARLPSAVAGFLSVLLIMRIARRFFDERTAALAGLVLATSFSFTGFARTASADMENVGGILSALVLFIEGGDHPRAWRIIAIWLVMAVTSLTKGLLGFALPILIIGVDSLVASGRRRWLLHWATPVGMLLAAIVYFAPFLLAANRSIAGDGLGMVFRENLQRFFSPHNHRGPIHLYAYVIFALAAPWSLLLPAALVEAHGARSAGRRFMLVFFWATFAFFTLSASRRSYYLLPILPAVALLVAHLLASRREELSRSARVFCPKYMGIALGATAVVGMAALHLVAYPAIEPLRGHREFAAAVRSVVADGDDLALYRTREVVYYLRPTRDVREFTTEIELANAVTAGEVRWAIMHERDVARIGVPCRTIARSQPWEEDGAGTRAVLIEFNRERR
jgi:4-amino-4-deoxy-L-arabinose transferase-like glycosyltransferase